MKTAAMAPLQNGQQISEEAIVQGFAELRENMAKVLTKTEF